MAGPLSGPGGLLRTAYDALVAAAGSAPDGGVPSGAQGWTLQDLVLHLHADCVRALVAVHTPADRPADTDAVSYWRAYGTDPDAAARVRDATVVEAGLHSWTGLRARHAEAAAAAVHAVTTAAAEPVVLTQGHAITVADLASTLVVEATLHHLDLVAHLPDAPGPSTAGLAETRRVCEALLDRRTAGWDDLRVALVATGRAAPTPAESDDLDGVFLPVFL